VSISHRQYAPARSNNNDGTSLDSLLQNSTISGIAHAARQGCRTRVASRPEQIHAAEQLVRKRYAWRGYHMPAALDAYVPDCDSARVTIVAEKTCGALVGTLSVRPDSLRGLLAEMTYASEIEELRRKQHRLGEVVKLAVEEDANSRVALDALVRSAYVVSRHAHGRTHVVIEVNPRHVRFYEKVLGFVLASAERLCSRVGAPSVLMELDLEQFGRRLQATAGRVGPALEVVA
jgi:N-acyl amino acid synthase FeeM